MSGSHAALRPLSAHKRARAQTPSSAQARHRARPVQGSDGLPSLCSGALRCSRSWLVAELTSLAALATFKQAATSRSTKRAGTRAARNAVLLGGAHSPCPGRARCLAGHLVSSRCRPTPAAGWPEGGAALGRLCAAEKTEHRRAPSRSEGKQSEPKRRTALGPALKEQMRCLYFCARPRPGSPSLACAPPAAHCETERLT